MTLITFGEGRRIPAIVNAYLAPILKNYVTGIDSYFRELGSKNPVRYFQSNGGLAQGDVVSDQSIFGIWWPLSSLLQPLSQIIGCCDLAVYCLALKREPWMRATAASGTMTMISVAVISNRPSSL